MMAQESRRPGKGDGSDVQLGGERAEPTENTLKTQCPILYRHWLHAPEWAAMLAALAFGGAA